MGSIPLAVEVWADCRDALARTARRFGPDLGNDDDADVVAHCAVIASRIDHHELPKDPDLRARMAQGPQERRSTIRAYLIVCAKNEALRLARLPRLRPLDECDEQQPGADDTVEIAVVTDYLGTLTPRDRIVVAERGWGETWETVADRAGCSPATARRVYEHHIEVIQGLLESSDESPREAS